jgi:tRNA-specific 2-thiouridylase
MKAVDGNKDQTYFLNAVSADALAETVFPLGDLEKADVRRIARDQGLPVSGKKDSTGICFIGERPFRDFLSTYLPANPGPMRTPDGREVGLHHGLMYYTLGQRQGLGIGGRRDADDAPWYVVDKDIGANALIVDQGNTDLLMSWSLAASGPSWINGEPDGIAEGVRLAAKIRYRQPDQACTVRRGGNDSLHVAFDEPQRAATPGQYIVFYAGDTCLGGAVIDRVLERLTERAAPAEAPRRAAN